MQCSGLLVMPVIKFLPFQLQKISIHMHMDMLKLIDLNSLSVYAFRLKLSVCFFFKAFQIIHVSFLFAFIKSLSMLIYRFTWIRLPIVPSFNCAFYRYHLFIFWSIYRNIKQSRLFFSSKKFNCKQKFIFQTEQNRQAMYKKRTRSGGSSRKSSESSKSQERKTEDTSEEGSGIIVVRKFFPESWLFDVILIGWETK